MKSLAKPFIDYGPIVVFFFFFFKTGEIQGAIIPLMVASVLAMILSYAVEKKIPPMLLFSSILILIFGFLTIYFDNPIFIKFKVTLVNLIFASILKGARRPIGPKSVLDHFLFIPSQANFQSSGFCS